MNIADLLEALGDRVDPAEARACLLSIAERLSLGEEPWTEQQALDLLEAMTQEDGMLGVTARFAKARVLLRLTTS